MRTMFDSITARDIPADAKMVAGYVNGTYQWSNADWALFPNATKVRIATRANIDDGHVLDVEVGAATPASAPDWVQMRRAHGLIPTVYCSFSEWASVRAAFHNASIIEPLYWIAKYDRVAVVPPGTVAKQYASPTTGSAGHYDLSAVADFWPGVDTEQTMATIDEFVTAMKNQVLAGDWRFDGNRNPVDMWRQCVATGFAVSGKVDHLQSELAATRTELGELKTLLTQLVHGGVTLTASGQIVVEATSPEV